jgi:hypothetical protein
LSKVSLSSLILRYCTMKWLIIVNLIAFSQAVSLGQTNILRQISPLESAESEPIAPYSFSYSADAVDGRSAREESSDGTNVVRGSYMISSADGIKRIVNYIADENGFRAQIQTNEPGTESKSPANVELNSSQPPAEEIALKYGPRPDEQVSQLRSLGNIGLKGIQKQVQFGQVVDHTSFTPTLKQKSLIGIPLPKNIETGFNTNLFQKDLTREFTPGLRTQLKPIDTPIRLLTKFPTQNVPLMNTAFKPVEFEIQQREELVQNRENY